MGPSVSRVRLAARHGVRHTADRIPRDAEALQLTSRAGSVGEAELAAREEVPHPGLAEPPGEGRFVFAETSPPRDESPALSPTEREGGDVRGSAPDPASRANDHIRPEGAD